MNISNVTFWKKQPTNLPYLLNGFNGTFAYTDHKLVPEPIRNFVMEVLDTKQTRFKKVPLDQVNELMNEVWEGPGSMVKLCELYNEIKLARLESYLVDEEEDDEEEEKVDSESEKAEKDAQTDAKDVDTDA